MVIEEKLKSVNTPKNERKIIVNRFFRYSDEISSLRDCIVDRFDMEIPPGDRDKIKESAISLSSEEFIKTIDGIELQYGPYRFPWFRGEHYNVEIEDGKCVVKGGMDKQFFETVEDRVHKIATDQEVGALVKGIIASGLGSKETAFRGDWNEAVGAGNMYFDGNSFNPTNSFKKATAIPAVFTNKSGSGRSFSVAAEIAPLIWREIDKIEEEREKPLPPAESEVPEGVARRKPKFTEIFEDIEVTEEDIKEFEDTLEEHDALEYWMDYIAPGIKYRPRAKKAVLCMLASPEDKHGNKGRTNAIFYGPPGTGKSAFKNFLVDKFGAYSDDGSRISRADLTYNKATEEPGLLVRAHRGLAVIEEADKMKGDELEAALTALGETGMVEIRDMELPAEVRGILLSNFKTKRDIQLDWGEPVFNRFEFIVEFGKLSEEELDSTLDWHYRFFRKKKPGEQASYLKKYLKWVRDFEPEVAEIDEILEYKNKHIDDIENVRKGISVMNVAYTIARLNHRDVTLEDFKEAMDLVQV